MFHTTHINEPRWAGLREVMAMSWPIILGSLSHTVMEFMDKFMVAQLGTAPLAAVGSAGLWSFVMSTVIIGIVGCVSTFVGQSLGRGETANCARYAWQGLYVGLGAGLVALVLLPACGPLFRLMNHAPEVTRLELLYFRIRLLGYVPMAWACAFAAFFQAVNRPRIPMYVAVLANAVNIALNYVLIFGNFGFPRLGVAGAAVATSCALFVHAVLLGTVFLSPHFHAAFGTRTRRAFDARRIKELVRIGIPSGASMFLDIANWGIFTSFVVGYFGSQQLAAHSIAVSFIHVCFMPAVAINQAIAPIVGQWIGRRDIPRAKARTYTALRLAMAYMTVAGVTLAVFGGWLIATLFSDDPAVIQLGHKLLILAAFFQAFDAINIICIGALRGAGDTRWMMWAMFFVAYVFFLPLALCFAFLFGGGAFGAWFAAALYIVVLSATLFYRFHGERWREINIFSQEVRPTPEEIEQLASDI